MVRSSGTGFRPYLPSAARGGRRSWPQLTHNATRANEIEKFRSNIFRVPDEGDRMVMMPSLINDPATTPTHIDHWSQQEPGATIASHHARWVDPSQYQSGNQGDLVSIVVGDVHRSLCRLPATSQVRKVCITHMEQWKPYEYARMSQTPQHAPSAAFRHASGGDDTAPFPDCQFVSDIYSSN